MHVNDVAGDVPREVASVLDLQLIAVEPEGLGDDAIERDASPSLAWRDPHRISWCPNSR